MMRAALLRFRASMPDSASSARRFASDSCHHKTTTHHTISHKTIVKLGDGNSTAKRRHDPKTGPQMRPLLGRSPYPHSSGCPFVPPLSSSVCLSVLCEWMSICVVPAWRVVLRVLPVAGP